MFGKRGAYTQYVLMPIMAMIITVGVILFGVGEKITHLGDSDVLLAQFYSRDIAYATSALQAGITDMALMYPYDTHQYDVELTEDKILFFLEGKELTGFPISNPRQLAIKTEKLEKPQNIQLYRNGNMMGLGYSSLNRLPCGATRAQGDIKELILDPDEGIPLKTLALRISNQVEGGIDATRQLRGEDTPTLQERKTSMSAYTYGLSIAGQQGERNIIKAYIRADPLPSSGSMIALERQSLACHVVSAISEHPEISGVSVIPLNLEQLEEDDPRIVLGSTNIGVYVVVEMPEDRLNIVLTDSALAKAVYEGLEVFFSEG
ncbi:MAG: hypothetical protein ABIH34_04900 [Nanoarchaeota archaeon]